MNVTVVGAGHVGLVVAVCLAEMGHKVICVDKDRKKIERIKQGDPTIYEPGLEEALKRVLNKHLFTTIDLREAIIVYESEIVFLTVGTESYPDGSINPENVIEVAEEIGKILKDLDRYIVVSIKSTVIPGTTKKIQELIENICCHNNFGVGATPEFLSEGSAIEDFMKPDRIVIGTDDNRTLDNLKKVFYWIDPQDMLYKDTKTAEMIKYASNAFLATKISFINEIGEICMKLGIKTDDVAEGMGRDKRISKHFLKAGIGFGGGCLKKDAMALIKISEEIGCGQEILRAALKVNEGQFRKMIEVAKRHINLSNKVVAVLGLAFKPNTCDVRESRSFPLIKSLLKEGCYVHGCDRVASKNFQCHPLYGPEIQSYMKLFKRSVTYFDNVVDAVSGADICMIVTEWEQFKNPEIYAEKLIIDGRNIVELSHKKNYKRLT